MELSEEAKNSIREMYEALLESHTPSPKDDSIQIESNRKEEDTSFWPTNKRANSAFDEDPHATEAISLGKLLSHTKRKDEASYFGLYLFLFM